MGNPAVRKSTRCSNITATVWFMNAYGSWFGESTRCSNITASSQTKMGPEIASILQDRGNWGFPHNILTHHDTYVAGLNTSWYICSRTSVPRRKLIWVIRVDLKSACGMGWLARDANPLFKWLFWTCLTSLYSLLVTIKCSGLHIYTVRESVVNLLCNQFLCFCDIAVALLKQKVT